MDEEFNTKQYIVSEVYEKKVFKYKELITTFKR